LQALASAGQFNAAYGAELARKSQYLDLEHVAGVLMAFDRAAERSSPVVGPLTDELWDGLVIRLHQGREIYGGLQARREKRAGLILPGETRTVASMTEALVRYAGDDPRLQILIGAARPSDHEPAPPRSATLVNLDLPRSARLLPSVQLRRPAGSRSLRRVRICGCC